MHCEACGGVMYQPNLHHRKLRSQGGKDAVSNLIAIHHYCHNIAKDSIHQNPKSSMVKGYIVPSYATPSEYPLHLPDGSIVRLAEDGSYIRLGEGNGTDNSSRESW
jgi:hypothetical protein